MTGTNSFLPKPWHYWEHAAPRIVRQELGSLAAYLRYCRELEEGEEHSAESAGPEGRYRVLLPPGPQGSIGSGSAFE